MSQPGPDAPPSPVFLRLVRFCIDVWKNFRDSHGPQHAGAIAYFGLLSVIPFAVFLVAISAGLLASLGLEASGADVAAGVSSGVPFVSEAVREQLVDIATAGAEIGLLSVVLLLFSASSVFTALNRGINAVMGTEKVPRMLLVRLLSAVLIIGVAASAFLWQLLQSSVSKWVGGDGPLPGWLNNVGMRWGIETAIFTVGFFVIVRLVAKVRYRKRYYWAGGLVFVILSQLARVGLEVYFARLWRLRDLYGGLGAIMGLVLWVYVAAIVLLIACSLVKTLAQRSVLEATAEKVS